jgi:three-Cys-motif partner protein
VSSTAGFGTSSPEPWARRDETGSKTELALLLDERHARWREVGVAIDPPEFFGEVQGAAVFKHGLLKRYLAVFASKVGSTTADHRVFFLDAYAGPGEYDDGGQGSPAIAKATAEYLASNRNLVGVYVEENKTNREKLRTFLEASGHNHHIIGGDIEENFAEVLEQVGSAPLLALIDPFGLAVPMRQIKALFERPKRDGSQYHPTTEAIINVSYPGIARLCAFVRVDPSQVSAKVAKQRETIVRNCNESLGGEWWQRIAIERPTDWVQQIAYGYAQQLHEQTGAGWFRVDVRDRPDGRVAYELLLLTMHSREANWVFHEQVSLANQDWRAWVATQPGQQSLPMTDEWATTIKANIVNLLSQGEFSVRDRWPEVYGAVFGLARSKHIREAIKALHKEGVTLCTGKKVGNKDLPDMLITRGPNAPPLTGG